MTKYALIATSGSDGREQVEALLPPTYRVVEQLNPRRFYIGGDDVAGWTLDGYVLPRLASGLCFGVEVDGSAITR